jgi:FtsH-binding integral membrane protein
VAQTADTARDELARRHGAAVRAVSAAFMLTLALVALALALTPRLSARFYDPITARSLLFVILFIGLGSIVFRRTKFTTMRLRDIAALRGASGLLETLQRTTVYVALAGGAVAVLGFVFTVMSGDRTNVFYPAVIAVAVLVYCYPRRAAWRGVLDALAAPDDDDVPGAKGTIA